MYPLEIMILKIRFNRRMPKLIAKPNKIISRLYQYSTPLQIIEK